MISFLIIIVITSLWLVIGIRWELPWMTDSYGDPSLFSGVLFCVAFASLVVLLLECAISVGLLKSPDSAPTEQSTRARSCIQLLHELEGN